MTDYTGVELPDIVAHCQDWRENTIDTINQLSECREQVLARAGQFTCAPAITDYIDFFIDLFSRYQSDLERLARELSEGVGQAHLETVRQLLESAKLEENRCELFREREIAKSLPDESVRPVLDRIYRVSRGTLHDYWDLSNVHRRLRALRGGPGSAAGSNLDALELKPNVFGIGFNFNYILAKLANWWRSKQAKA